MRHVERAVWTLLLLAGLVGLGWAWKWMIVDWLDEARQWEELLRR